MARPGGATRFAIPEGVTPHPPPAHDPSITKDALFNGRVVLHQPVHGYRVNVDAVLLASFAHRHARARVAVDLGAGVGAVGLSLLHLGAAQRVLLIEVDAHAATLARTNLSANGWRDRGEVVCADVAEDGNRVAADLVVCNPPYVAPGRGRLATDAARSRARSGDLATFVRAARRFAGRRARACFVYPARELGTLLSTLRAAGLEPKRLRAVHASPDAAARVVLVEARAAKAGGLEVEPALVER